VSYGSNILRSTNEGSTWTDITVISNVSPHTDHHAIVFDSSNRMLIGNDGGIWRYDSTVPSWTDLNGNLDTIQFQGIGLHPTSSTTVVGGSQDNGTELYTANPDWALTDGGDGGFAQFSQTNGSDCYFRSSRRQLWLRRLLPDVHRRLRGNVGGRNHRLCQHQRQLLSPVYCGSDQRESPPDWPGPRV